MPAYIYIYINKFDNKLAVKFPLSVLIYIFFFFQNNQDMIYASTFYRTAELDTAISCRKSCRC